MIFRCLDCKEEDRSATMKGDTTLYVELNEDGTLYAEIAWTWDVNEHKSSLRCRWCAGKVEIVNE